MLFNFEKNKVNTDLSRLAYLKENKIDQQEECVEIYNYHLPNKWQESLSRNNNPMQKINYLDRKSIVTEYLMMGLRLSDGIDDQYLYKLTGLSFVDVLNQDKVKFLNEKKFIEFSSISYSISQRSKFPADFLRDCYYALRLTKKGIMIHNYILSEILKI
ncbi:MAG TPA: hypothetical protein QKA14_00240 [Candidatus Megaira endosymbiont of Hartmannula sinica]|nr:hypothetical protein [Candidatus Megaera endosymbiont of Hartmannula sinica]